MARTRIELDLNSFGLDPDARKGKLRIIGEVIAAEWRAEARQAGLKSTLQAYVNSVGISRLDDMGVTISLPGPGASGKAAMLARMIEFGMGPGGIGTEGPYDIRTQVLKAGTRNLRWGKNGPYVNIPFGHSVESIEARGGERAKDAAAALGGTIHTFVLKAHTKWGGRLSQGYAAKIKPHHVTDPLHGLVRKASTYSKKGKLQSTYQTFRRMSWAGKAWMHPGIKARKIGARIAAKVPQLIAGII